MTTPQQVDKMRDSWLDPGDEFDDNTCPWCEAEADEDPGYVMGDKWEWWCSKGCGFYGDRF